MRVCVSEVDDTVDDDPHPMAGDRVRIKMRISTEQTESKQKWSQPAREERKGAKAATVHNDY